MIRNRATCLTSSTLSRNSKDFTSALNKLWNVLPPHSLASFFSPHTHTHSAMFLFSPTRGLYFEFYKEKTTRDTIRNESDRYVSIFFISKKKSLKIRIQGGTKIEIWLNTRCCCFFPQKISWIKCVENYEYEYLKDYYFSTFRYYSSSIKSFFFFGNKLFISFNLRIFHIYFFFINWIDFESIYSNER